MADIAVGFDDVAVTTFQLLGLLSAEAASLNVLSRLCIWPNDEMRVWIVDAALCIFFSGIRSTSVS